MIRKGKEYYEQRQKVNIKDRIEAKISASMRRHPEGLHWVCVPGLEIPG
jgi:hypothetical protein